MPRDVDYSAFRDPVTKEDIRAYKERAKSTSAGSWARGATLQFAALIGTLIIVAVVLVPVLITGIRNVGTEFSNGSRGFDWGAVAFVLVVSSAILLALYSVARMIPRLSGGWERSLRLERFGEENDLVFVPRTSNPDYPGMIFADGRERVLLEHFRSTSGRFLDFGSYCYVTGSGKNRTTHQWGYLALALDRQLPNMVLDAKSNNSIFGSNLPATLGRDQVLSLEGDFNKYFILYCPRQYETDALYVFTPDLMALLIDESSAFDVEIVDNWMFVYSSRPFDVTRVEVIDRLLRIVDTVGAKTLSQTERYRDERVGSAAANIVAPQGRRLRRSFSVVAVVFLAGVVIFNAINFIMGVSHP